ncbi:MAG: SDR family NAD(P)-dependent oxidoreductase [Cyanobacteria bacterium J06598_1]
MNSSNEQNFQTQHSQQPFGSADALAGKVALVTGATRGIGKGIAIALIQAGATVYITGRSLSSDDESNTETVSGSLAETQAIAAGSTGICIPCQVDHSDDKQVKQLFEHIRTEQNGRLDLLVNNVYGGVRALRNQQGKPFWEADASLWDACNNVGLRSHYMASRFAAQLMVPRNQGLIVTISSWGGLSPIFGVAYGTGKSACDRLAAEMATELKPHNVTSIALWPGIVGTEHISEFVEEAKAKETPDARMDMMSTRFNWETPIFTGRVIAALLAEPNPIDLTGKLQIVAELAARYGVTDENGERPASLRSLKFLLPAGLPVLQPHARFIPDLRVPWWLMLLTALSAPKK